MESSHAQVRPFTAPHRTLTHRVISPVRITDPSRPVHVELPGIVHRFAKGHRIVLAVSGGDLAYKGNNVPGPVQIRTSAAQPGVLRLPVAVDGHDYGKVVPAKAQCKSTRVFNVRVRSRYGHSVRTVVAKLNGRRIATRRGRNVLEPIRVDLRGRGARKVALRLRMRLSDGRIRQDVRRYQPCRPGTK